MKKLKQSFLTLCLLFVGLNFTTNAWAATHYLAGDFTSWGTNKLTFSDEKCSVYLTTGNHEFQVLDGGTWTGNSQGGTITRSNCSNWTFYVNGGNCKIDADKNGYYTFTIHDWANNRPNDGNWAPKVTVTYPDGGFFDIYVALTKNGASTSWQKSDGDKSFGNITSLVVNDVYLKCWDNFGTDKAAWSNGAGFGYKYNNSDNYINTNGKDGKGYDSNQPNNYQFKKTGADVDLVKLVSGNSDTKKNSGNYTIEVWGKVNSTTNGWGDAYLKNGDNNFKWTFTILPPAVKDNNIVISTQNVYGGSGTSEDPYLVASGVKPRFTVETGSGKTEQAHTDANSVLWAKFKSGSGSFSSYSTTLSYEAVSTNQVNETKQCTITVKYRNDGANLDGTTAATKIVYYKLKTTAITLTGETNGSALAKYGVASMQDVVAPTKTGYNIPTKAYYSQANFTDETYYIMNNSGTLQKEIAGFTDANKKWVNTATEVTLYTNWQPNTYTMALDGQGATTAGSTTATATYDALTLTITLPQKTGYTLDGFYTGTNGSGTKFIDGSGNLVANITYNTENYTNSNREWKHDGNGPQLYANWTANKYYVVFNKNNESATGTMQNQEFTYDVEQALSTNYFEYEGHHFTKWTTNSDGTGDSYDDEARVSNLATSGNFNLYAQWEEDASNYEITYNGNGNTAGTAPVDPSSPYAAGSQVTVLGIGDLAKTGYTLTCWNSKEDGTGTDYAFNSTFQINSNIILYAKWTAKTYDLTLDNKGGTPESQTLTVTYDATCPAFTAPTRIGYDYKGYVKQGTTSIQIINQGGTFTKNTVFTTESKWTYDGEVTLDALWKANEYGFAIDANTGTSGACESEITFDVTSLPISETYSKVGYNLTGFFTAATDGNKVANADGTLVTETVAGYVENGQWKRTEATTLYAQWQAKTYTISFNQNGGTGGQTESVTATYDQAMPTTITLPTRVGYKFLGYYYGDTKYYNADGSSACSWNLDPQEGSATLTAKWDQIHVYIEGRFKVRASEVGAWKYVESSTGTWKTDSKTIEFTFDEVNNKYILHTYAYFDELAENIGGDGTDYRPYFHLASYCNSEDIFHQFGATSKNYEFKKTVKSGATTGTENFVFGTDCHDGSVDLIYDPVAHTLSYESVAEQHYNVTFIEGGQGTVNTPGTQSVGVRGGWNITATPKDAYRFDHWSTTGGAHVANASSASTAVTVDGDGTVTANFVFNKKRVYFQMPKDWVDAKFNKVFVYFYKGAYWNEKDNGSGSKDIQHGPHQMTWTGDGNVYYYDVDFDLASSVISFTNDEQSGYERFNGTSVCYREDFDQNFSSAKMMFVPDNWITHTYYCDKKTDYYNRGSWQLYSKAPEEYYVKHDHTNPTWTTLSELRFEPTEDKNIRKTILRNLTANTEYKFQIWRSTGNWYGCDATITGNVDNYKFYYNNSKNCTLKPKYAGNYELTLNVSDMQLSVRYLADFYIRSFPEAVSVVPNGIKRVEPKIDLRDEYDVENLHITITGFDDKIATLEQSGYNIIVTGVKNGTTTATITYDYNGNKFVYPLTIVVGPAVTIQAKIAEGDGKWIYTNMVNVHYWLSGKTADVNMKYTESGDDKYYTASIPLPADRTTFSMIFWYGENIDMSSSEVWRKTADIENLNIYTDGTKTKTQSYCFTINHTAGVDEQRTEEHTTGLCIEGDAIYQVEVTMKNGKMYTSNVVSQNGDEVSFFAPNTSASDYTQGTIRLMKNGAEIMQTIDNATPGVYTATLNIPATGNASLSDKTLYTGDFYVLSGLSSAEKNNASKMTEFTRQSGEAFSYYWVAFSNDCPSKNANATLANAYNDNLSIAIGSDKKTDSEGNVESGNVRFSYEPTTNEFKRAVIGGSTENPKFLALVGNNVYDTDGTIALDDAQYALPDTKCKFTDASDWVYEKNIVIKPDGINDANVYIKSQFNGELTELLGYEINPTTGEETTTHKPLTVMGKATTSGEYEIRIIYDYKKNRLLSAWEPTEGEINQDLTIESDVMFIGQEDEDVKQVTIGDVTDPSTSETRAAKLTSLQHVMYVKEFLQTETLKTYWMSLPFDCRISDIYGIGGYGTVWRIQEYDGTSRAANGWLHESQTFWKTMSMDEEMKAGYGYLLQIVRSKMDFHQIEGKAALRLYFPSKDKGFTMTRSAVGDKKEYPVENCELKGREAEDSNWKLMGPLAYNNIKVEDVTWSEQASKPEDATRFPSYLYEYDAVNKTYNVVSATDYNYRSFHAFMTQFGGTIEWAPYTQTKPGEAPRFADLSSSFKGGRLTIELVQSEETLDRTFVTLSQYGTEGFDQNKDLTKIAESRSTISTITNNVEYAGNTLPLDIELVPLNVKVTANGTYDIVLNESLNGLEVRLYDAFEQTTTPLDMMSATIILDKGEYKDRFFLQLKQKGSDTPTSFDGKLEQYNLPTDKTQKLLINDQIYLINGGRVYNATGVQLR